MVEPSEETQHGKPWTYEHYLLLPEDGKRHEIIDGEHYVTPAPKTHHQRLLGRLFFALETARRGAAAGEVLSAPCDLLLSETNVVQPDLLYVSEARRKILTEDNLRGAPDLVVEILSASTRRRDEVLKRKLYERFGVAEYWIVDAELESVKVYRADGAAFGDPMPVEREKGGVLDTPLLPGLSLALDELFAPS